MLCDVQNNFDRIEDIKIADTVKQRQRGNDDTKNNTKPRWLKTAKTEKDRAREFE